MTLQELVEELEQDGANFRGRSYSGRAMYGRECLGVVGDAAFPMLQTIAWHAGRLGVEMPEQICFDQMGKGSVLYWPELDYVLKETT